MHLRSVHKLFLSYLALVAAVVAALTLGVGGALRGQLVEMVEDDMLRELRLAVSLSAERGDLEADSLADWIGALTGRRATLIDAGGTVVGDSEVDGAELAALENHAGRAEVRAALGGGTGRATRRSASLGTEQLYVAALGRDGRVVRLAVPLREVDRTLARLRAGVFGVGLAALVLSAVLSLGITVAVTRPLRRIIAAAREMTRGDLGRRAGGDLRGEFGELAEALDTLAGELQRRLGQLEGERAEVQALFDAMSEGVVAFAADGTVLRANTAARRIFLLPREVRGMRPEEVSRRPGFVEVARRALAGAAVPPAEVREGDRHLLATAQPLRSGGAVTVFLDVSELRRLEEARRDFVANASHELKTPLTAIRGYSETLLDESLDPELRRRFAATVRDNAERLQRIVDDLLDLSRIESGGWRVAPEIVSVAETAAEAWAPLADAAGEKEVELSLRVPPECEFVLADPSALRQVLANLFGNAVRYVEAGGRVGLSARCATSPLLPGAAGGHTASDGSGGRTWVEVAVEDDGAGIPSSHLGRVFERFYRVDAARSRDEGGTGLGLSIVRHLVERHGGTVAAESELGRGTTIRFTLPAPEDEEGGADDLPAEEA